MAYAPPPPPSYKRPYPEDWPPPPPPPVKRPYPDEWAPPWPAPEPRPYAADDYTRPAPPWGSSYPEYGNYDWERRAYPETSAYPDYTAREYGDYGWGNPESSESSGYHSNNTSSNNISVDFTDDYSAFYSKDDQTDRGDGNQRGNKAWSGEGQFESSSDTSQGGMHNRGQGRPKRGRWNQNRGQGNQNRGRGNVNRGQFNQSRGQGKPNRGQFNQSRDQGYTDGGQFSRNRGQGHSNRGQGNQYRGRGSQNRGRGYEQNRGGSRGGPRGQFRGRGRGNERGMPPNTFSNSRGRGRGSYTAGTADSGKPKSVTEMSKEEKFEKFCEFLKSGDYMKGNNVQIITNAVSSTRLGLKAKYEIKDIAKVREKQVFTGVLTIDDVYLARAIRPSKKDLKHDVYHSAFTVLTTKSVPDILNLVDPGPDALREELDRQMRKVEEEIKYANEKGNSEVRTMVCGETQAVLAQLIEAINKMKNAPENPISVIEQASTKAHILIRQEYKVEITRMENGLLYCQGQISVGPVVIGRGRGITKKKCKTETYINTLKRLKTLPIEELMESIPEEPLPDICMANKSKTCLTLEDRFAAFIASLEAKDFKESNMMQLDVAAIQNGIIPMLLFRPDPKSTEPKSRSMICEFYLEKIFIASSEGIWKRDVMCDTYNKSLEVLSSTSIDTLLTKHKRITDAEVKDPKLLDVIIKGTGKTLESNTSGLRRVGYQLDEIVDNKVEDLVLVEHSGWARDRIRNAFCILQYSCNQNGMMLQWETSTIDSSYRCVMSIQKKALGVSYGAKKTIARYLAATDALFKLYETQDVIKIASRNDDEQNWIPWETITAEADMLKDEHVGEEPMAERDEQGNPIPDYFVMEVLKSKMDEFVKSTTKNELIFGPGSGLSERQQLRNYAFSINLKCDIMQFKGEPYMLLYHKASWKEIVDVLKKRGGEPYGKFVLVDKNELPKHADVMETVMKYIPKNEEEQDISKNGDEQDISKNGDEQDISKNGEKLNVKYEVTNLDSS